MCLVKENYVKTCDLGLIHATELAYLFGVYTFGKFKFNENDLKLKDALVNSIAYFVYRG